MAYFDQVMSLIRREVIRTMRKFHQQPRVGLVSSYDKKLHAVKVLFQPSGTESGWIPLTSPAVGNQFGIASAPNIRDEVDVHFQEGEHMVSRVVSRHFNKLDKPPQLDPGEHIIVHKTGSGHYFKKDGTVQHVGPQFFKTGDQESGTSGDTSTGNNGETGQQVPQQQQQKKAGKQSWIFNPDGSTAFNVPDPNAQGEGDPQNPQHTTTVKKNISVTSQQGNISHTASTGNISQTASQGSIARSAKTQISDKAQTINHDGNTNVAGNLGVSGSMAALGGGSFGTASLSIDGTGHFNGTSGGEVTGGFSSDTLTVTAGATISSGGLTITAGGLTVTAGGATISAGGMHVTGGLTTDTLTVTGSTGTQVNTAPSTKTGTSYTVGNSDSSLIFNTSGTHTLTLPSASTNPGRWLYLKNVAAQAINSASSNVVPVGSTTAGTSILAATAGKYAWLQSDSTNWIVMASN